jgi:hypothetical protein
VGCWRRPVSSGTRVRAGRAERFGEDVSERQRLSPNGCDISIREHRRAADQRKPELRFVGLFNDDAKLRNEFAP